VISYKTPRFELQFITIFFTVKLSTFHNLETLELKLYNEVTNYFQFVTQNNFLQVVVPSAIGMGEALFLGFGLTQILPTNPVSVFANIC